MKKTSLKRTAFFATISGLSVLAAMQIFKRVRPKRGISDIKESPDVYRFSHSSSDYVEREYGDSSHNINSVPDTNFVSQEQTESKVRTLKKLNSDYYFDE